MIPYELQQITSDLRKEPWIQEITRNADVYVVGGSVRDAYLGKPMKDIDLIVDGLSINGILKILKKYGRANLEGESFSVIKFKPKGYEGEDYDIAVPREDRKIGKGHKGFQVVTDDVTVDQDLERRDFTINSMAVDVMDDTLMDIFGGLDDLQDKLLRATDTTAFSEDPLRILRGIQFAARFGFEIEPETMKLMQKHAHEVKEIAGERIYDEFQKILNKEGDTQLAMDLLHKTGVDEALFDQKMLHYEEGMDHLDPVSFYYILGLTGNVDPYEFYMKKLKGSDKQKVGTAIKVLDNLLLKWESADEEEKKYMTMKAVTKVPRIADIALTPGEMDDIVLDMRTMKIPMNPKDVPVDGDEVQAIFGIPKGEEVGKILERVRRDALMNKFNWKDKEATLDYVSKLKM